MRTGLTQLLDFYHWNKTDIGRLHEDFEFEKERRLFYVALTRAKHRVYVIADMTNVGPFIVELI